MRGQRLLFVTITPFSVEKASEGRPWMFQSLTAVGLARKVAKEKSGVHGMCNSRTYIIIIIEHLKIVPVVHTDTDH